MGIGNYGDSGAPMAGEVSSTQRAAVAGADKGNQAASAAFNKEDVVVPAEDGLVAYVAAGSYANTSHLVKAGEPVKAPMAAGGSVGIIPLVTRTGDIWAKFVNGSLVTEDPDVIAWCDDNTEICRRSDDPMTKGWATLKELQTRKSNRESLVDSSEMNADETFPPSATQDNLREQASKSGSPGSDAVEAAEQAKSVVQERAAQA